jgi:hypothetical protein
LCHAGPTLAAHLDLTAEHACDMLIDKPSCLFPARRLVVPGHPEDSFLFHKLTGQGLGEVPSGGDCGSGARTNQLMPNNAEPLDDDKLELVRGWIAAGALCSRTPPPPPTTPAIVSFTANRSALLAGETVTFTVVLDHAAPRDGQLIAHDVNTSALSMPVQAIVPPARTTVQFDGYALRPTSRFMLRATTGASSKALVLRIAGLEIAEVLADPSGADDGLQWIKLRNRSSFPLDLSSYQLKAGEINYELVTLQLVGMIPAGGCAVIGGPTASSANGDPIFTVAANFQPDLPRAGGQAAGFAVFDKNAAAVGGVSTPVDTMLVGAINDAGLVGPDAEIAPPYCATPASGTSARRTGPSACVQAQMQPNTCP